jgi:hypothetical protein
VIDSIIRGSITDDDARRIAGNCKHSLQHYIIDLTVVPLQLWPKLNNNDKLAMHYAAPVKNRTWAYYESHINLKAVLNKLLF